MAIPRRVRIVRRPRGEGGAVQRDARRRPAGTGRHRIFISVDLPAPFSPSSTCTSPGRHRQVGPAQGVHPRERLVDPPHGQARDPRPIGPGGHLYRPGPASGAAAPGPKLSTLSAIDELDLRVQHRRRAAPVADQLHGRQHAHPPHLAGELGHRPVHPAAADVGQRVGAGVEADHPHRPGCGRPPPPPRPRPAPSRRWRRRWRAGRGGPAGCSG